jgi:predicted permease
MTGLDLMVFGRLTPGATLSSAQAELTTIGRRTEVAFPKIYAQLRPRVMPYTNPFMGVHENKDVSGFHMMQGIVSLLLVLVCLNVAILVYSRTAMRQSEIAIRTALGAGRGRIVAQLFIEAFLLSALAALAGIAIAEFALRQMAAATLRIAAELPFWLSFHLSPGAVLYAGILSVLAAAIVGVVPALKATTRRVQTGLRIIGTGGSGMRLGNTWTVLVVAQVGCAVALLPAAVIHAWAALQSGTAVPGFAAEEFLSARLGMDYVPGTGAPAPGTPEFTRRFAARQAELMRRLEVDSRVSSVTFSMVNPGEEAMAWIETEGVTVSPQAASSHEVRFNRVDMNFFRTFHVPVLAGRGFEPADLAAVSEDGGREPEGEAVVVNRTFAQQIFGGGALGRRIRYIDRSRKAMAQDVESGRWYQIVGIVSDFPTGASPGMDDSPLKLYHAAARGQLQPVTLALRTRGGDPSAFSVRLREIAAAVDPELHLGNILSLDEALRREQWIRRLEAAVLSALTLSVLLLSSAGIYALMSITVLQRRKEIGIRLALGAGRKSIVASIFSRALGQLAIGAALGVASGVVIVKAFWGDLTRGNVAVVLPAIALFMMGVGFLAALGPARRALGIEPVEALREQ